MDDCGLTNYFKQPTSFTCAICQDSCATCLNNATDCGSCRNVAGTVYYLTGNNSCVSRCPAGQYGFDSNNTCLTCHLNCTKCFGPSTEECSACASTYFSIYGTSTCNASCPDGQFANATNQVCLVCNSNCRTCLNASVNCNQLLHGGRRAGLPHGTTCVQRCPAAQQRSPNDSTCQSLRCWLRFLH